MLDQDLRNRAGLETAFADGGVLLRVVCDSPATAAEGEGRANDPRKAADGGTHRFRFFQGGGNAGGADLDPDSFHRLLEQQAVFRFLDGLQIGTDQLNPMALENAAFGQRHRQIQGGLSAHGRQQGIRTFLLNHPSDHLGRKRFDVSPIRHFRVGHDRRRIGIHQDHLVALSTECLAGLCSGIVEFTGLSDHDRTRTQQKDSTKIGPPGHGRSLQAKRPQPLMQLVTPGPRYGDAMRGLGRDE